MPFYDTSQDLTYYFCAWMIIACIFTLTLQDIVYLQGFGDDPELFWVSGDTMSYILIGTNVAIVLQILFSSDAKRRKTDALTLATLFNQMILAEVRRGLTHSSLSLTRQLARPLTRTPPRCRPPTNSKWTTRGTTISTTQRRGQS